MDQIMHAADLNYWDLPFLQKHANPQEKNTLCWPSVLGECRRLGCAFIHEKGVDLPGGFIEEACLKLEDNVKWVVDTQDALPTGPLNGGPN